MITFTDKGAEKVREFLATQSAQVDTAGLRVGVRGRECDTEPRRAGCDRRRSDRRDEQALLEQALGRGERRLLVADHHGDDRRRVAGPDALDVRAQARAQDLTFG